MAITKQKIFYSQFWDWKLIGILLLTGAIFSSIYNSYAIWLIGNKIPQIDGLAILAQYKFVELLIEVFQEALVLPMFYYLSITHKNIEKHLSIAFTITLLVVGISVSFVIIFISQFINFIGTADSLIETTIRYLRFNLIASLIGLLAQILLVCIKSARLYTLIIIFQLTSLGLNIFFNALFIGGYEFSLAYGVIGHSIARIFSEFFLLLISGILFLRYMKRRFSLSLSLKDYYFSLNDIRNYINVVWGSALDVLVRNLAYSYMILFLINQMGTAYIQGYYLAMHIIWSFGMIPIFLISEATKILVSTYKKDIVKVWYNASILTGITSLFWIMGFIFWKDIASSLNNDPQTVAISVQAAKWLIIPYLLLIFNLVTDSLFYGTGKTQYLAYQSLLVNGIVYGIGFILYQINLWSPDFNSVLILFGVGIVFDSILTLYYSNKITHLNLFKITGKKLI